MENLKERTIDEQIREIYIKNREEIESEPPAWDSYYKPHPWFQTLDW